MDRAFDFTPEMVERLGEFIQELAQINPDYFGWLPGTFSAIELESWEDMRAVLECSGSTDEGSTKIVVHVCRLPMDAYDSKFASDVDREAFAERLKKVIDSNASPVVVTWPDGYVLVPGNVMKFDTSKMGQA